MRKLKILVVEDVPQMRNFERTTLEHVLKNVDVEAVGNGIEAKQKLEAGPFDLVLCDWEMPGMGGDELLQWMRSVPSFKQTPFVMVTGRSDKEYVLRAINLGVTDYIVKPVTVEVLIKKVAAMLRSLPKREDDPAGQSEAEAAPPETT